MPMSNLEAKLWILEHHQYLQDAYEPILHAALYKPENIAKLSSDDVYMLATAIRGAVYAEAWKRRKTTDTFELCGVTQPDYIGALKAMSLLELRELRERINFLPTPRRRR
jgi:hypothetical protein